jgi:UPF0271 protein
VQEQIRELQQIATELNMRLTHVKPHGALYNQAARDAVLADAVTSAVHQIDPRLKLFGLAGSVLITAAQSRGLAPVSEIFADRRYQNDGSLVPRSRPDALIADPDEACAQVLSLIRAGHGQTVCVHGDGPHTLQFARQLRSALQRAGIEVQPCAD